MKNWIYLILLVFIGAAWLIVPCCCEPFNMNLVHLPFGILFFSLFCLTLIRFHHANLVEMKQLDFDMTKKKEGQKHQWEIDWQKQNQLVKEKEYAQKKDWAQFEKDLKSKKTN